MYEELVKRIRWLELRVQDLEDSRELTWGALVAPLYDRVHRLEAALMGDSPDPLDPCISGPGATLPSGRLDADWVLQQHFIKILTYTKGNMTHAASLLGVNEKTVHNWRRKWEIDPVAFRPRQGPPNNSTT